MTSSLVSKDLTKEPPRSPYVRIHGFALLGRSIDKCRAFLLNTVGEYSFNCPLDRKLFSFKGLEAEDFKTMVESGASDEAIGQWVFDHGTPKTEEEIKAWSDSFDGKFDSLVEEDEASFSQA